jgi:hypothetical protein
MFHSLGIASHRAAWRRKQEKENNKTDAGRVPGNK